MLVGTVSLAAVLVAAWGVAPPPQPQPPPRPPSAFESVRSGDPQSPSASSASPDSALSASAPAKGPVPEEPREPIDFVEQLRTVSRVTACAPAGVIPARFDAGIVEAHCKTFAGLVEQWSRRWLSRARPFFDQMVPPAARQARVVYPFGGGDLLTAMVVFPNAPEITTLSLEPAGDPRRLEQLDPGELTAALLEVRKKVNHIFTLGHSKTTDMLRVTSSKLPGDLTYTLVALELNGMELLSAKFFELGPAGEPVYLTRAEVDAMGPLVVARRQTRFANLELKYRARAGGPPRVFRHIAANLDNAHMETDPTVLRHLEAKGRIAAMTKAASYLLWWKDFSKIRDYLLRNMVWMVSDSTGIPTEQARAAGFEQIPFGRFEGPFLGRVNRPTELFRKLWSEEAEPLTFRFGYPDSGGNDHLLITRPATQK